MELNRRQVLFLIILILGFSLLIGNASATTTYNKKTSIYTYQMNEKTVNGHYYSYYKNGYIKIVLGNPYLNGYVYGTNPVTGKYEKAPVYGRNVIISPLSKNVKIKTIYTQARGYPSYNLYTNKYTTKSNQWIAPGKYKGFWKFTVYYTVTYIQEKKITTEQAKNIAAQFTDQTPTGDVIYNSNYNYYQVYLVPKDPEKTWPDYRFVDAATGSIVEWINGVLSKIT